MKEYFKKTENFEKFIAKSDWIIMNLRMICNKDGPQEGLAVLQHALIRLAKTLYQDEKDYETFVKGFIFLATNVDEIEGMNEKK